MPANAFGSREREDLINALYDSLSEVPMWESFLLRARAHFGCQHVALVLAPPQGSHDQPVCVADDDAIAQPTDQLWQSECCRRLEPGLAAQIDEAGIEAWQVIGVRVNGPGGMALYMILWRARQAEPFGNDETTLLTSLAAPLQHGLRVYERFVELGRQQMLSNAAIETSGIGAILADTEGRILQANPIAEILLKAGDGLRRVHGRLKAACADDTAKLIAEIRQQASEQSAHSNWERYSPLALRRTGKILPLTVIVRPGPAFFPLKRPLHRTAMLIVRDPDHQPNISPPTLASLFGLTPAEATLASALSGGASLEEAAAAIGVSRHTVRSQLQGIFLKTGTNRQGELVRILLNSAAASSGAGYLSGKAKAIT